MHAVRVLMLTHNMAGIGGSFMRSASLAGALVELGHEVTLLVSRREIGLRRIETVQEGVRILQMPDLLPQRVRHGGLSPIDLSARCRFVLSERFDLIHGFDHRPAVSLPALLGRRRRRVPYVADWADLWGRGGIADERTRFGGRLLGWLDHRAENTVHRRADAVTAITTELAGRARALGVPHERVRLVPVGANTKAIVPLPKAEARAKLGLALDRDVVVHIGFAPYDAQLLTETFAALARRNPRALLVLSGGRMRIAEELLDRAGLGERMVHFGVVPYERLGEVLACGDVMLLPYSDRSLNRARYPNRVGDYLAAGRPIATNPTGDVGRMVRDEGVGLVADAEPEAFAGAIQGLLEDAPLREEMGRRARHLAETRLSWRSMAVPLEGLYQELMAGRQRPER